MSAKRRAIRLDSVRADGWFERLAEGSPNFDQLCEAVGDKFVAFAVIAGVRITALTVDKSSPDATLIDFVVAEGAEEQRLPLGEFRRRLASALLTDEPPGADIGDEPPTPDRLQAFIGFRYVLLAPLFGIRLVELRVGGDKPSAVVVDLGGASDEISLEELREVIRERIRAELQRARPASPFSIDLAVIPHAEQAAANKDHARVVEILGAWPGPLSLLLRTAEGQQLTPDVRATLARALGLLGTAYVHTQRYDWAEEVMRLGVQWGQDGPAAGDLFRRLGESCVIRGRFGEAIGLLRRSLSLGVPEAQVLPDLAKAYVDRGKWVAGAACARRVLLMDPSNQDMKTLLVQAQNKMGAPWLRFQQQTAKSNTGMRALFGRKKAD